MSNSTDNAPVAHSAGAAEESRPSLSALLLDPSFWADWASVVGLVGLVIVFGIAQPVFWSLPWAIQAFCSTKSAMMCLTVKSSIHPTSRPTGTDDDMAGSDKLTTSQQT